MVKPDKIKDIMSELNSLIEAREILEAVYAYMDPYTGKFNPSLPDDVRNRLLYYFRFDDSE